MSLLSSWVKSGLFTYAGRRNEGEALFKRGECALLTTSSAAYANIQHDAKFEFGVMPMPYYDDINNAPYNTAVGGAGLWVMNGKKTAEYKGVAAFLVYLAQPDTQAKWHQKTGYLPLSRAAYDLTRKAGYYDAKPGADIPIQTVTHTGKPTAYSRGVRLGNYALIRAIIDEELEAVWAGTKSPKAALDNAVKRGDEILRRFEHGSKL
ncbi:MAG TPA: extracellular solute-binding protein [Burkholderiales bacterium]